MPLLKRRLLDVQQGQFADNHGVSLCRYANSLKFFKKNI